MKYLSVFMCPVINYFIFSQVNNSIFVSNMAESGGVLYLDGSQSEVCIEKSSFTSNKATSQQGSDIYMNSTMELKMPNTAASVDSRRSKVNLFRWYLLLTLCIIVVAAATCVCLW